MTAIALLMQTLLDRIYRGEYPAGNRIPDRESLRRELSCNMVTLQAAMDLLQRLGHVVARGKHGTFIPQVPACKSRIAVIYPDSAAAHQSTFTQRLTSPPNMPTPAFAHFKQEVVFDMRQAPECPEDGSPYTLLDIGHYAAQVLPVEALGVWSQAIRSRQAKRPWVVFAHRYDPAHGASMDCHLVSFAWDRFFDQAIANLARRGRKQIVLIHYGHPQSNMAKAWCAALERAGRPVTEFSVIPCAQNAGYMLEFFLRFADEQLRSKIDAVVVSDESITGQTLQALQSTGFAIPRDVEVVSQATFPLPLRRAEGRVPVSFLGYSTEEAMHIVYRVALAAAAGEHIAPRSWELTLQESAS